MNVVEEYGKTVQEAQSKALRSLGVESFDEIEFQVLDEGGGRKFARVKATRKTQDAEAPAQASQEQEVPETEEADSEPAERAPRAPRERDEQERTPRVPRERPVQDRQPRVDPSNASEQVVQEILDLIGLEARIEKTYDEIQGTRINVTGNGEDLGILIGKFGQTAEALQYLVNMIVTRRIGEHGRITLDIEGYRERRERQLEDLALRMARRVKQEGKSVTLEPMLPSERRIVHLTLSEDPGVKTYSQGEEPMRTVIISPARQERRGGRGPRSRDDY